MPSAGPSGVGPRAAPRHPGLYLLSDLARGVTGEIHHVDAGYNKIGIPSPRRMERRED